MNFKERKKRRNLYLIILGTLLIIFLIKNQELKEKIVPIAMDQHNIGQCSHLLVFAAWDKYTEERIDLKKEKKEKELKFKKEREEEENTIKAIDFIKNFYINNLCK